MLAPFGDDPAPLQIAVEELALKGKRTELFSAVLSGLKALTQCDGYRQVLVLLSDGDAEDDPAAYTIKDAVQATQQQGIALYTLGFNDTIKLQILRRLSDDTGAWHWPYKAAEAANLPAWLAESTDTGGNLRVPLANIPAKVKALALRLTLADGQQLQAPLDIELPPRLAPWQEWLQQRFPAVPLQAWAPGLSTVAIVVLLFTIWLLRRRRRHKKTMGSESADPVIPRKPLAKIITGDSVFVMDKLSISIGALPENDLVIDDPTVSRHQATIDYQDTAFHLTDRGSTNSSQVNDEIMQHCILNHGDKIQFGNWHGVFEIIEG